MRGEKKNWKIRLNAPKSLHNKSIADSNSVVWLYRNRVGQEHHIKYKIYWSIALKVNIHIQRIHILCTKIKIVYIHNDRNKIKSYTISTDRQLKKLLFTFLCETKESENKDDSKNRKRKKEKKTEQN